MHMTAHQENGYDRLEITDPLPEELFNGDMIRAIWQSRSLPWAWRDPIDARLIRFVDDFGHRYTYQLKGFDQALDVFRLQLVIT